MFIDELLKQLQIPILQYKDNNFNLRLISFLKL